MHDAPGLCAMCGGKCCKQMSGSMTPGDVMKLFPAQGLVKSLKLAFESGDYVIDWWEGDPRGLSYDDPGYLSRAEYVRPRVDTDRSRLHNPGWSGRCVFLAAVGCRLEPDDRPAQCRLLEPQPDDGCIMHNPGSKRSIAIMWVPHQNDLFRAARPFA